jgi:hypothetical protein
MAEGESTRIGRSEGGDNMENREIWPIGRAVKCENIPSLATTDTRAFTFSHNQTSPTISFVSLAPDPLPSSDRGGEDGSGSGARDTNEIVGDV